MRRGGGRRAVSWRVSAVDEGVDSAADADCHFQFRYANKCLPIHPAVVLNETCLWISISSSATVYFWSLGLFARSHSRKHTCMCMIRRWDAFRLLAHVTNVLLIHLCVLNLQRHVYLDSFIWLTAFGQIICQYSRLFVFVAESQDVK